MKPRVGIAPPARGYVRQWVRCRTCRQVAFYDYVPYSLSNPVRMLGCGHTPVGTRDLGADHISAQEGQMALLSQKAARAHAAGGAHG